MAASAALFAAAASWAGLGGLTVQSGLGEPFSGSITVKGEEAEALRDGDGLAVSDSSLKAKMRRSGDDVVVRLYTRKAVSEPVMVFRVTIGSQSREYTAILDPKEYVSQARQGRRQQAEAPEQPEEARVPTAAPAAPTADRVSEPPRVAETPPPRSAPVHITPAASHTAPPPAALPPAVEPSEKSAITEPHSVVPPQETTEHEAPPQAWHASEAASAAGQEPASDAAPDNASAAVVPSEPPAREKGIWHWVLLGCLLLAAVMMLGKRLRRGGSDADTVEQDAEAGFDDGLGGILPGSPAAAPPQTPEFDGRRSAFDGGSAYQAAEPAHSPLDFPYPDAPQPSENLPHTAAAPAEVEQEADEPLPFTAPTDEAVMYSDAVEWIAPPQAPEAQEAAADTDDDADEAGQRDAAALLEAEYDLARMYLEKGDLEPARRIVALLQEEYGGSVPEDIQARLSGDGDRH
ncbi:TspA protein [Bergeriella denitrificans]|uniref:TspA protein n=2 Tax=Bergeriella denitrificans TaxID=494 RepID=A0A378UDE1_BERDE|nr:TspA protein [Bergeriella denitrificans]